MPQANNDFKVRGTLRRDAMFDAESIQTEARTIELVFSTEAEIEQWYGIEVLGHKKGECDLTRFATGTAALLCDHNWKDQVGVIESASVGTDRMGRAVVRFGKSERAEEIFQDVVDGIRRNVSVGYYVNSMEVVEVGKDGYPTKYRATNWQPFEISIVSVPADIEAGVGRAAEDTEREIIPIEPISSQKLQENKAMPELNQPIASAAPAAPVANVQEVQNRTRDDERNRIRSINEFAAKFSGKAGGVTELAARAVESGLTVEAFQSQLLDALSTVPDSGVRIADHQGMKVGLTEREANNFSFFRAMRAIVNDDKKEAGFEMAVIEETRNLVIRGGGQPRGNILVPYDVMVARNMSVGGSGSGAELVGTTLRGDALIDVLRSKLLAQKLGVNYIPGLVGNVSFPKITNGGTVYWVTEGNGPTQTTLGTGQLVLSPKTIAAKSTITRRLMQQSSPQAEGLVRDDLMKGAAGAIDQALFNGDGVGGEPLGIVNVSGVGSVSISGSFSWDNAIELESDVETANALEGNLAYVTTPSIKGGAKKTLKSSGVAGYIWDEDKMNGYTAHSSTGAPSGKVLFGNWSDVIIGQWGIMDILLNPYANNDGGLDISIFQDVDVGVRHAGSFSIAG